MAQLIVIKGPDMGRTFELAAESRIGRGTACSIALADLQLEELAATIRCENGCYRLDAAAGQPLALNGQAAGAAELQHGDLITLGQSLLLFDDGQHRLAESSEHDIHAGDMIDSRIEERQSYESAEVVLETLQELDRPHGRLVTQYKIASAISGELDLGVLLDKLLALLFEQFKPDRGCIMLLDRTARKLRTMASRTAPGIIEDQDPRIPRSIVREVFSSKDSILATNAMTDRRFMSGESVTGQQITSALCAPLIHNGEILGLVHLDCQARSGAFDREDLDHLTRIAMQAAVAIHNARIMRRSQQFSRKLLALGNATQALNSYLRSDLIVRETAGAACRVFGCTRCSIFLLDRDTDELYLAYSIGLDRERWSDVRVRFGEGIIGWVAARAQPLRVESVREVPAEIGFEFKPRYDTTSFLAMPVQNLLDDEQPGGSVAGVICVTDKVEGEPFHREDQELLSILASHLTGALANARFYQELKVREEQIQLMNKELERRVEERTAELHATRDQLVQSEKMAAIGLLAAGVSHEFNNVVTSMFGFAQMAQAQPKYQAKLVEIVLAQSQRAREITESLLSFSRQHDGRYELASLPGLMDEVLRIVGKALANESIDVVKRYAPTPEIAVVPGKLHQVFLNLIINARDAIERDGVITIEIEQISNELVVRVSDTGKGIRPENLRRVFEPFFTTKGSFGGSKQPGTGVGLSVCYNLIAEHGGEITADSRPGAGSTFTVRLPARTELPPDREALERQPTTRMPMVTRQHSVLVVDDDPPIREILNNILGERDYRVTAVANAADAIEVCKKQRVDCIFLDIKMPGKLDGYAAFEEIRRIDGSIKIIFITGQAEDERLQEYVARADGYIRKPFKVEEIYELLES